jgi:hypothetical protein
MRIFEGPMEKKAIGSYPIAFLVDLLRRKFCSSVVEICTITMSVRNQPKNS